MSCNEPLFDGTFYGWKFGPVLKEVRSEYKFETYFSSVVEGVLESTQKLLKQVLDRYGSLSSWKLSGLSHEEFSWKKARAGLAPGEDGDIMRPGSGLCKAGRKIVEYFFEKNKKTVDEQKFYAIIIDVYEP